MNLLGNSPNVSSLLNQSFGNGNSSTSLSSLGGFQHGLADTMIESNPVSKVPNDVGCTPPSAPTKLLNSVSSSQIPSHSGSSTLSDQQQIQPFEPQKFQHGQQSLQQFPVSRSQAQQQLPQFQSIRGGLGVGASVVPVKLEPDVMNDQIGLQSKLMQSLGPVKLELQQNQIGRGIGPVKLESQHSDQALFLQQQQQLLHMSRQSSQAAIAQMNFLWQQRILQQQQQQLLGPRPQPHQQSQQQKGPIRSAVRPIYEPGTCAQRLIQYMYQQQHRPAVRLFFLGN